MKALIVWTLFEVAVGLSGFDPLLGIMDPKIFADEINAAQNTWTAGDNFGRPLSMKELKRFGSTILKKPNLPLRKHNLSNLQYIPSSFDLRAVYWYCQSLFSVRDQSNCGSCWAVSSTSAFSDRLCIQTYGAYQANISAESLMDCCSSCGSGCNGGSISDSFGHFKNTGEVTGGDYGSYDGCQPYSIPPCGSIGQPACEVDEATTPACQTYCTNPYYRIPYPFDRLRLQSAFYVAGIPSIQWEIMTRGPLVAPFELHPDFLTYKNGIYKHTDSKKIGGHALRIIGWGEEDGMKYWLAVNSWGPNWGDNGCLKFLRGSNECQIESGMVGGDV